MKLLKEDRADNKTNWHNWIPIPVKVVGTALILFGGYRLIQKQVDKQKTRKRKREIEDSTVQYFYTDSKGQQQYSNIDLGTIAAGIYDSFYNNDWFGWSEDEERAMRLLLSVPREFIPDLENTYTSLYGEILREDFVRFLSDDEFQRIQQMFK